MDDPVFGALEWEVPRGWKGKASAQYLQGMGEAARAFYLERMRFIGRVQEDSDPSGVLCVRVPAKNEEELPSPRHRESFAVFKENGERLYTELLATLFEEYQAHLEFRRQWWKAQWGDYQLELVLPVVNSVEEIRRLIEPGGVYVLGNGDIVLMCEGTYLAIQVIVRQGKIVEIESLTGVAGRNQTKKSIHDPTLGFLSTVDGEHWAGKVRSEAFREFRAVAQERAKFQRIPREVHFTNFRVDWNFTQGDFYLTCFASNADDRRRQGEAWRAFIASEQANVSRVMGSVLEYYRKYSPQLRLNYRGDESVEKVLPNVNQLEEMRHLVGLYRVWFSPANGAGPVEMAFEIVTAWDESVYVLWAEGSITGAMSRDEWKTRKALWKALE